MSRMELPVTRFLQYWFCNYALSNKLKIIHIYHKVVNNIKINPYWTYDRTWLFQYTSAFTSIRLLSPVYVCFHRYTSVFTSIRLLSPAYVCFHQGKSAFMPQSCVFNNKHQNHKPLLMSWYMTMFHISFWF